MTPSLTLAVRLSAAAALASACGLLAACGSTPAPGTATATKTVTVPASANTSTSPAATPSAASPATHAGPAGCLSSGLQAQLGVSQGTAGTIYQVIILTNTSNATCTLYGYPGVSFVTGVGGSQVGQPATKNPAVAKTLVTLAPGAKANMLLAIHDAGAIANCQITTVDWVRIYAPGDYGSVYVQYNTQACAHTSQPIMSVTAVRAGAGSASY
jgi:hypothetical protein